VVIKRKLSNTVKLSALNSVFVPILTCSHWSWAITEIVLSQEQAAKIGFLLSLHSMTLRDKVRSCEYRKILNVESIILRIERSQPRWFGHMTRMLQERLVRRVLLAALTAKQSRAQPRTRWPVYISDLAYSHLGVEPSELIIRGCWKPWGISRPPRAADA